MRRLGAGFQFSPSDLTNFIGCDHLTQLEIATALGEMAGAPLFDNAYADLISRKGDEHEQRFLEALRAAGHAVTRIGLDGGRDFDSAAEATLAAMRAGVPYIHQAVFVAGGWRGLADFLERVNVPDKPSAFGPWHYVVLDTKLARAPRPEDVLQLCFYSHCLEQLQALDPKVAYVVLGTHTGHAGREQFRLANVSAYYRRLRRRFEAAVRDRAPTTPYPCEQCRICAHHGACDDWWDRQDHLVRVADIRRDQISRLATSQIDTLTALAQAPADLRVRKMAPLTLDGLREQAALQLERRRTETVPYRLRPLEDGRGFALFPRRSRGDVILDLEGHPFYEPARGLEFLFGVLTLDGAPPRYQPFWAHDRAEERRALEAVVDLIHARLAQHPDLHVYHYGAYESSALKRLMGEYATREFEIDDLLRRGAFTNLYPIVRQALRAGVRSYSLKDLEPLVGFTPSAKVRSGMDAIVEYERWIETQDGACLDDIAAYNEDDCRATLALLDWLHRERPQNLAWPEWPPVKTPTEAEREAANARERLRDELLKDRPEKGSCRWLAAHLLEYHRREARPAWWIYFERQTMTPDELLDDTESLGCLAPDPATPPEAAAHSLVHTLTFPHQDHKLGPGSWVEDPATGRSAGEILKLNDANGTLRLKRGPSLANVLLPKALVPAGPINDYLQRDAVLRFVTSVRDGDGRYPTLLAILETDYPRVRDRAPGDPLHTTNLEKMKCLAVALDQSYLFIQGPPGTGKTHTGGRLIADLIHRGKRVGVASQSHTAIHNLLNEVEAAALEFGVRFAGAKKSIAEDPGSTYKNKNGDSRFITNVPDAKAIIDQLPDLQLVAGTAWFFARADLDRQLDYLVIDEAGQVSLADAIAMGTSACNLILLGDPLQLRQVSQGTHPAGCEKSVLEHLLGEERTIPQDRGVFLEKSYRMHPDVCGFISEVVYAGRLHSDDSAARRTTSFGTGIRFIEVDHQGNRTASDEEAVAINVQIRRMLGGSFTDDDDTTRPLAEDDFMVVAPYNAQVNRLRRGLPAGVHVGTVDKFQGKEAPVVFFSMATSSGEDVPRNLAFLFSRHRLNVAISRAQCLAFLVCSPRLLEARCQTIEEMELVNDLCRLVECAEGQASRPREHNAPDPRLSGAPRISRL